MIHVASCVYPVEAHRAPRDPLRVLAQRWNLRPGRTAAGPFKTSGSGEDRSSATIGTTIALELPTLNEPGARFTHATFTTASA